MSNSAEPTELLYATPFGSVRVGKYTRQMNILYKHIEWEQTVQEFVYLQKNINSLYKYIVDVRKMYYRRFWVSLQNQFTLGLNMHEIQEIYDLLGGAQQVLDVQHLLNQMPDDKVDKSS